MSQKSDELFREFLFRVADRQQKDLATAAGSLMEHEWNELPDRTAFYSALREPLIREPADISAVSACVKAKGSTILGGHASFRSRLKTFLESDVAADSLGRLLSGGQAPPQLPAISEFIQTAVKHGFENALGNPAQGDAAYFTSVLLTAVFPDDFVGCRLTHWEWLASQFSLPSVPNGASSAERIVTAAQGARELSETATFREFFASPHPLWTVGALTYLLHQNVELKTLAMRKESTVEIHPTIKEAFGRFRSSPKMQFGVRLRARRAEQLRQLLADPQAMTLETFNRDVWNVWTSATLDGQDVLKLLVPEGTSTSEQLAQLQAGLDSGSLELHGNCMWGTAAKIFGPMISGGDAERLTNVRKALEILNEEDLEPLDKVAQITGINGFGDNIATGLVMVMHPQEFAIYNGPSKSAISKLGYHAGNLESFQGVVGDIRAALGADDFIELDYFFYLIDQGFLPFEAMQSGWWVSHGAMYDVERKNGYLFAPKQTEDGKTLQYNTNVSLMQPGEIVLHYDGGAVNAVSTVKSPAEERTRPDPKGDEDPNQIGYYVRVTSRDLMPPIQLDQIPMDWRTTGEQPFTSHGNVKQGYAYAVSHVFLKDFEKKFGKIEVSRGKRIVKIAPGEGAKFWDECLQNGYICVGWGDVGDLRLFESFETYRKRFGECYAEVYKNHETTISKKANEVWSLTKLTPGDVIVANRGISHVLAVGEVLDPPYDFDPAPGREEYAHLIRVRWNTSVAKDIPKQGYWALTTVAEVPADLYEFIIGEIPPNGGEVIVGPTKLRDYVEPSFEEIRERIAKAGLRLNERMLRRFHLSLKTRGFVILCGLSGSGKTWLADLYAEVVGAESALVPVAPNWTTNEDLIGYHNPMDGLYHDTAFSKFLRRAAEHYEECEAAGVVARPYHLILDEMNLARVEYYFAKFLSAMEQRSQAGGARIDLSGQEYVKLPPNLFFIGTVNVDETTHAFADKVYDRAQLLEVTVDRDELRAHLGNATYADLLMQIWDAIGDVTPFAFRVLDEFKSYVDEATKIGVPWEEAVDEQLLQKVLTKIKGAEQRVEKALDQFMEQSRDRFPLSHAKAKRMLEMLHHHGITSYF